MRSLLLSTLLAFGCGKSSPPAQPDSGGPPGSPHGDAAIELPDAGDDVVTLFEGDCSPAGWCWTNPLPFGGGVYGLYLTPSGTLWALGSSALHRKVGGKWTSFWFEGSYGHLAGAGETLFVVGKSGLLRFDGTRFHAMKTFLPVNAVAARSPDDAWAVGNAGSIFHFDGRVWEKWESFNGRNLLSVAVGPEGAVWVGGAFGERRQLTDGEWKPEYSEGAEDIVALAAHGSSVWSATDRGVVSRRTGGTWTDVGSLGARALHARGPDDLLVLGDGVTRIVGGAATTLSPVRVTSIAELSLDDVWLGSPADGFSDATLLHGPLDALEPQLTSVTNALLRAVNVTDDSAFATANGPSMVWKDGSWKLQHPPYGDWFLSQNVDQFWLGDPSGKIVHGDGVTWTEVSPGAAKVFDLWGLSDHSMYAAASDRLLHWDGSAWSTISMPAISVSGTAEDDVWISTATGVAHYDGTTWTSTPLEGGARLVRAASRDDVWLAGEVPTMLGTSKEVAHFDGTAWKKLSPLPETPWSVAARGGTLWVLGPTSIVHGDGTSWITEPVPVPGLGAIGVGPKELHVVGRNGYALRRPLP